MTTSCNIEFTIVGAGPIDKRIRTEIERWTGTRKPRPPEHLTDIVPAPTGDLAPAPKASAAKLPELPNSDWPTFLADCRRRLDPATFTEVHRIYTHSLHQFHDADYADETGTAKRLAALLVTTTDPNAHAVIIEAARAAAMAHGYYLEVDRAGVLANTDSTTAIRAFTDADWARVVAVARPRLPSVVALVGAGVPEAHVADVPGDAVADDAGTVRHRGETLTIPTAARVAVRAQHLVRRAFGAGPDDPFLLDSARVEPRDAREFLSRMRELANTPVRRRYRTSNQRWQYRNGISLTPLTP
jgi:hypothetical protein